MSPHTRHIAAAIALALLPGGVAAQQPGQAAAASPGPAVRPISTASALSSEGLGSVVSVRELPDGRLLVNDGARRRLLLMDSTLRTVGVVLDSASDVANTYGTRPGTLIPFRGDTTLFLDPASYALLVIDPAGRVVRVRSVWRVRDVPFLSSMGPMFGVPGVDRRGRVVYRIAAEPERPRAPLPGGVPYFPTQPDSAFIVAADVDARKVDTVGVIRIARTDMRIRRRPDGSFAMDAMLNPLPLVDDWAVLSDGTVALVRGRDYRVDYRAADGTVTSSPRLPYPWQRLTDQDKDRLADSLKTAAQRQASFTFATQMITWVNAQAHRAYPRGFKVPDGFRLPPGLPRDATLPPGTSFPPGYLYACGPGETPQGGTGMMFTMGEGQTVRINRSPGDAAAGPPPIPLPAPGATPGTVVAPPAASAPATAPGVVAVAAPPAGAAGTGVVAAPGAAGGTPPAGARGAGAQAQPSACVSMPPMMYSSRLPPSAMGSANVVPASELPDYRPPLGQQGAVRADLDDNLWIRTQAPPVPGGAVFDIVSRSGMLTDRLQIPTGYTVVGFGRGKVVYLSMRDARGVHVARVRLR